GMRRPLVDSRRQCYVQTKPGRFLICERGSLVRKLAEILRASARTLTHRRRTTFVLGAALAVASVAAGVVLAGGASGSPSTTAWANGPATADTATSARELAGRPAHQVTQSRAQASATFSLLQTRIGAVTV